MNNINSIIEKYQSKNVNLRSRVAFLRETELKAKQNAKEIAATLAEVKAYDNVISDLQTLLDKEVLIERPFGKLDHPDSHGNVFDSGLQKSLLEKLRSAQFPDIKYSEIPKVLQELDSRIKDIDSDSEVDEESAMWSYIQKWRAIIESKDPDIDN